MNKILALLMSLTLAACSTTKVDAPVSIGDTSSPAPATEETVAPAVVEEDIASIMPTPKACACEGPAHNPELLK